MTFSQKWEELHIKNITDITHEGSPEYRHYQCEKCKHKFFKHFDKNEVVICTMCGNFVKKEGQ